MSTNKKNSLGEFELIDWLRQQVGQNSQLVLGIGDDCSIQVQQADQDLLTSTDLLIEGVHFQREWSSMFDLGRKSVAVNISDIAAMGGTPRSLFLGLGRPESLDDREIEEFLAGFLAEARAQGAVLAGGDTCRSQGVLMISVTVQGTIATGKALCRQGASYGDAIYVSGTLGDSALALQQLQSGQRPDGYLLDRFQVPTPQVALGQQLSERQLVTAMIDISDGLLADLGHILTASGVGAELELEQLPLSGSFRVALKQDHHLIDLAFAGGEDYELVMTSPLKDLAVQVGVPHSVTRIGTISQEPGLRIRGRDGELYHCQRGSFDHFA